MPGPIEDVSSSRLETAACTAKVSSRHFRKSGVAVELFPLTRPDSRATA
jgi:hypothetical protein